MQPQIDKAHMAKTEGGGACIGSDHAFCGVRADLWHPANHFRSVNKLMGQIWTLLGGMESPQGHLKYVDRSTREAIADLLLQNDREGNAAAALTSQ